MVGHH